MIDLGGDVTSNGISKLGFTILSAVAEAERYRICERVATVKADQKPFRYPYNCNSANIRTPSSQYFISVSGKQELPSMQTIEQAEAEAERLFRQAVAERLKAIQIAFQLTTNPLLGDVCGAKASAVNNWKLGYSLPRVPEMIRLCERTGVTLDWVYTGSIRAMDPKLAISLGRIIDMKSAA